MNEFSPNRQEDLRVFMANVEAKRRKFGPPLARAASMSFGRGARMPEPAAQDCAIAVGGTLSIGEASKQRPSRVRALRRTPSWML